MTDFYVAGPYNTPIAGIFGKNRSPTMELFYNKMAWVEAFGFPEKFKYSLDYGKNIPYYYENPF